MKNSTRWVVGTGFAAVAWSGFAIVRARAVFEDRDAERTPFPHQPGDPPVEVVDLTHRTDDRSDDDVVELPSAVPAYGAGPRT